MWVIEHKDGSWFQGPLSGFTRDIEKAARFATFAEANKRMWYADNMLPVVKRGQLELKEKWFGPSD